MVNCGDGVFFYAFAVPAAARYKGKETARQDPKYFESRQAVSFCMSGFGRRYGPLCRPYPKIRHAQIKLFAHQELSE